MKKILITGGAGFIGSNLAKKYQDEKFSVAILDNFSNGKKDFVLDRVKIFEGDIKNSDFVKKVFQDFKPDIVSHHASLISVKDSMENPANDARTNILGSINIFEQAGIANVKQVIFASSGGAIQDESRNSFPTPEVSENFFLKSPYALSKLTAEKYLAYFAARYNFSSTIFRYANVYGPHQTPTGEGGVIAIFGKKMIGGESPTIFGDGKQTRDFVYIGDVVEAHFQATEKKLSGIFNIGSEEENSIVDLFKKMAEKLNLKITPEFQEAVKGEILRSLLSSEKFKKISGWAPKVNLETGLKKTLDWMFSFYKTEPKTQDHASS